MMGVRAAGAEVRAERSRHAAVKRLPWRVRIGSTECGRGARSTREGSFCEHFVSLTPCPVRSSSLSVLRGPGRRVWYMIYIAFVGERMYL